MRTPGMERTSGRAGTTLVGEATPLVGLSSVTSGP